MKGFTLTALIVTIAIICTIGVAIATTTDNNVSVGINGIVETRCLNGLQFIVGEKGRSTQVMDTNGHGVSCTSK
jgi:hypothetical protein